MTETIVIAELSNNAVHPSTAELVSAAMKLGDSPTLIVPCTDASVANSAVGMGAASIIAAKAEAFANYDAQGWASAIDAVAPQGIIVTGSSPQSNQCC